MTDKQKADLCTVSGQLEGIAIAVRNNWADPEKLAENLENIAQVLLSITQNYGEPE